MVAPQKRCVRENRGLALPSRTMCVRTTLTPDHVAVASDLDGGEVGGGTLPHDNHLAGGSHDGTVVEVDDLLDSGGRARLGVENAHNLGNLTDRIVSALDRKHLEQ